jgi:hypothetical protein
MSRSPLGRPSPAMLVALLALVVAAAGTGVAAIPDGGGTFTGCYQTSPDILNRIVLLAEPVEACPPSYARVTWGQTGPAGATGPAGPLGAGGATDVLYRVFRDAVTGRADAFKSFTVPPGSWVVLAKATVDAQRTTGADCFLSGPGGGDKQEIMDFEWGADSRPVSPIHKSAVSLELAGTVTAPTKVVFGCAALDAPVGIREIRVLAMPVSSVDGSTEEDPLTLAKIRALIHRDRVRFARSAP